MTYKWDLKNCTKDTEDEDINNFLLQKIIKQTNSSRKSSTQVLDWLLNRLRGDSSAVVKIKCLKVIKSCCEKGSLEFSVEFARRTGDVSGLQNYRGETSALTGNELNKKVRELSKEVINSVFLQLEKRNQKSQGIQKGGGGSKYRGFSSQSQGTFNQPEVSRGESLFSQYQSGLNQMETSQQQQNNQPASYSGGNKYQGIGSPGSIPLKCTKKSFLSKLTKSECQCRKCRGERSQGYTCSFQKATDLGEQMVKESYGTTTTYTPPVMDSYSPPRAKEERPKNRNLPSKTKKSEWDDGDTKEFASEKLLVRKFVSLSNVKKADLSRLVKSASSIEFLEVCSFLYEELGKLGVWRKRYNALKAIEALLLDDRTAVDACDFFSERIATVKKMGRAQQKSIRVLAKNVLGFLDDDEATEEENVMERSESSEPSGIVDDFFNAEPVQNEKTTTVEQNILNLFQPAPNQHRQQLQESPPKGGSMFEGMKMTEDDDERSPQPARTTSLPPQSVPLPQTQPSFTQPKQHQNNSLEGFFQNLSATPNPPAMQKPQDTKFNPFGDVFSPSGSFSENVSTNDGQDLLADLSPSGGRMTQMKKKRLEKRFDNKKKDEGGFEKLKGVLLDFM